MNAVFADTSFYIALLKKSDELHALAIDVQENFNGRIITTQWVLSELGNFFCSTDSRKSFTGFLADLKIDPGVLILPANFNNFEAGAKLYGERPDKSWSMVDCISFATMLKHGITDAWTADHHFTQAGFNALLV